MEASPGWETTCQRKFRICTANRVGSPSRVRPRCVAIERARHTGSQSESVQYAREHQPAELLSRTRTCQNRVRPAAHQRQHQTCLQKLPRPQQLQQARLRQHESHRLISASQRVQIWGQIRMRTCLMLLECGAACPCSGLSAGNRAAAG